MDKQSVSRMSVVVCVSLWCAGALAAQKHLVPADKGLTKESVQKLYERGERAVYTGEELETIGMP